MSASDMLEAQDLDLPAREEQADAGPTLTLISRGANVQKTSFQDMKSKVIEEFERAYLSELLTAHQGNVSKAARTARKERRVFQRLLQKHGLDRRVYSAA